MSDRRPEATEAKGDALLHERASATPLSPVERPSRVPRPSSRAPRVSQPRASASGSRKVKASLRTVQRWFEEVITAPGTVAEGVTGAPTGKKLGVRTEKSLLRVVTAGPRQSALERLHVYHHAYRARLVEVLLDDYPSVAHAIGESAFETLCHAYVQKHPSRSPNLNHFGRHMPALLRAQKTQPVRRFLADLAELEWAMVDAIHAPDASVLSLQELAAIPPEQWEGALLPKSDSLRLLSFAYPVNAYLQALRDGKAPAIPEREPSATAVYRNGKRIWRMDLTPEMAGVLANLFAGKTLGEALSTLEASAEAERNVMVWFQAWVAGGFFARVEFRRTNNGGRA